MEGSPNHVLASVPEIDDNGDSTKSTDFRHGIDNEPDAVSLYSRNGARQNSITYPKYNGPRYVDIDGVRTQIPDVNAYQHKKTLAQGMMDLALLSANANQLRYVLETYKRHPYYYPSLMFISLSIILQIAVGVGLLLNSRYNVNDQKEICRANKINNYTVIGIFVLTVVNVFITSFGVSEPMQP